MEGDELKDFNRTQWGALLDRCLEALEIDGNQASADRKSAQWKLAIASKLKRETSVTNAWLGEKLSMGVPNAVSDYCGKYAKGVEAKCPFAKKLKNLRTEH